MVTMTTVQHGVGGTMGNVRHGQMWWAIAHCENKHPYPQTMDVQLR